jgi:tRNA pseudouridine55 synthase
MTTANESKREGGRRRSRPPRDEGPAIDGLLLADKQKGITSHDVVDIFRRRTRIRKTGHTGTLDPMATGLLVLCVGRATRLQSYLMGLEKTYEGEIQFGWATDTYDAEGKAVGEPVPFDVSGIDFAPHVAAFSGEIDQMPPAYSAKKVDGVRAYELARKGEAVALKTKRVTVHELAILGIEGSVVRFRLRASAGTYVRSVAHELGIAIGSAAHVKSLRRTAIGPFTVDEAIGSERIAEETAEAILAPPHFRSLAQAQLPFPHVMIDPMQERKMRNGQTVVVKPQQDGVTRDGLVAIDNADGELIAIAQAVDVMREGGPVALAPRVVL